MNHKLTFVKIGPTHQVAGVGFAGNLFITLSTLVHVGDDERMYVDMTHDCICSTLNSIGDISLGTQYRNAKIRIFPNPILNNELNISSSKPISYIQISNLTGQVVFSSVIS